MENLLVLQKKYVTVSFLHSTVRLLSKSSVYEDKLVKKSVCVKAYSIQQFGPSITISVHY